MLRSFQCFEYITTPQELQDMAARLEAAWNKTPLGSEVPCERILDRDGNAALVIRVDQEKMHHGTWRKKQCNFAMPQS